MEQERLIARMGRWFRRAAVPSTPGLPPVDRDGFLEGVDAENDAAPAPTGSKLSRHQLREQTLDKLQDGHLKVVSLIESVQKHMEVQDRRGEGIARSLEGMSEHLARLSESAGRQNEILGGIATQLRNGHDQARRWDEVLSELPALAEAQRDTLAALSEQVAAGRRADDRIGESLEALRGALDSLDRSNIASASALRRMQESTAHNQDMLGELILKQRTWLTRLVVVTLCVAVASVAVAVVALVR